MSYASFSYYSETYGGSMIPEERFDYYAARASEYIDHYTFDRLVKGVPEELTNKVSSCCCELAESIYTYASITDGSAVAGAGTIASESNGKYSVTYQNGSDRIGVISARLHGGQSGLEDIYGTVIHKHLDITGLLYSGVD
ncbi:hypothetical protein [Ruminococcus flavefaciens]|uniref:hypothetical protein n=1 Tax=Ruminococcus flavefaciens TaxID=1265 RepID=UPI0015662615|nr:hypothetical protein [Ruminococcus flavefaciens]